jgi:hypothetical protein
MKLLDIKGDAFHPERNYTINPREVRKPQRLSMKVS